MKIGWLRFASNVEISSSQPIGDCVKSLRLLIGRAAKSETQKPYAGFVEAEGGEVQQRLSFLKVLPMRILKFRLTPSPEGCHLTGRLALRNIIRVPVGIYLALCICSEVASPFFYRSQHGNLLIYLLGPIISFLMIFGWTCLGIRLNRSPEDQMIKALKNVLMDEASAAVVVDILSPSRPAKS